MKDLQPRAHLWVTCLFALASSSFAINGLPEHELIVPVMVEIENISAELFDKTPLAGDITFTELDLMVAVHKRAGETSMGLFDVKSGACFGVLSFSSPIFHIEAIENTLLIYLDSPSYPERLTLKLDQRPSAQ